MDKNKDRLRVIENIRTATIDKDLNRKAEEGDPIISKQQREKIILKFDILKKNPINRIKGNIARRIVEKITNKINFDTKIHGLENILNLDTGAIITCNHFSKVDSTIVRYMFEKINRKNDLYIIVQETNMLMKGKIGWLLKNCYTIPISDNFDYTINRLMPAMEEIFEKKDFILIYPEQEMWYNYKKPRTMKLGAYHYACKFDVPIIPCFIEIQDRSEMDSEGFYKSRYVLHILEPIYPDKSKNLKERKKDMRDRDYMARIKKYEEVYNRSYDSDFDIENDIAGWN